MTLDPRGTTSVCQPTSCWRTCRHDCRLTTCATSAKHHRHAPTCRPALPHRVWLPSPRLRRRGGSANRSAERDGRRSSACRIDGRGRLSGLHRHWRCWRLRSWPLEQPVRTRHRGMRWVVRTSCRSSDRLCGGYGSSRADAARSLAGVVFFCSRGYRSAIHLSSAVPCSQSVGPAGICRSFSTCRVMRPSVFGSCPGFFLVCWPARSCSHGSTTEAVEVCCPPRSGMHRLIS